MFVALHRPLLYFLLLLVSHLFLAASAFSSKERPIIHSVTIKGIHTLKESVLVTSLRTRPKARLSADDLSFDLKTLNAVCHEYGFYVATVRVDTSRSLQDTSAVEVVYTIVEGAPLNLAELVVSGCTDCPEESVLRGLGSQAGSRLDPAVVRRDIDVLLRWYERKGYPFTRIAVGGIDVTTTSTGPGLALELFVDEGELVSIEEVRLQGNTETQDGVILREARVDMHILYDPDQVEKIQRRLSRLNMFSNVRQPEVYVGPRGGGLLIEVEEGNTNTFDGVLGYVPGGAGGADGMVTGLVDISMRNLFGTARKLNVRWQRDDRRTQEIGVRYVEPWFFGLPLNLGAGLFQRQQDTVYVRRIVDAKIDVMLSDVFVIGGVVNQEHIIPSSTLLAPMVATSRTLTMGIEIRYDSRDDAISPTSGVRYRSEYLIGSKDILATTPGVSAQGGTVQKVALDLDSYHRVFGSQVAALGVHGRQITADQVEVSDRYQFGGTNTLRGYVENQFSGSKIAWSNAEYRLLLARHSYLYGFFDMGYYVSPGSSAVLSVQKFKYGYGVGFRLDTDLGNIGVNLALGEGDGLNQAKVHFGLINQF